MKALALLPNDILYEIFLLVTEAKDQLAYNAFQWDQRLAPWNLAATCKRWRTLSLDSPRLWTNFHFLNHTCISTSRNPSPHHTCINHVGVLRYYLALDRARDRPLTVIASTGGKVHDCCASMLTIASFRPRTTWKALKMGSAIADMIPWPRIRTQLSTLRTLDFDNHLYVYPEDARSSGITSLYLPPALANLEDLRRVRVDGWNGEIFPPESFANLLPWSRLQVLCILGYAGGTAPILSLLALCHNLHSFRLHCKRHLSPLEDPTNFPPGSEVITQLHDVELEAAFFAGISRSAPISSIFPLIRTPNLTTMRFGLVHFSDFEDPDLKPTDEQAILDLVRRSNCKVVNFEVEITSFPFNPDTPLLLKELKDLRSFTLGHRVNWGDIKETGVCACADGFLEQLIDAEDGMVPCGLPQLEHLKLRNLTFEPALLIQIVESRIASEEFASIRRLDIEFSFQEEVTHLPLYRRVLCDRLEPYDGLEIHFGTV